MFFTKIIVIVGILSLGYYYLLIRKAVTRTSFKEFYLLLFCFCMAALACFYYINYKGIYIDKIVSLCISIGVIIAIIFFLIIEGILIIYANKRPEDNAEYIVVLGAKVNGSKPSRVLENRINAAYEYLLLNPATIAIVSGGKGEDEEISEAQAMKNTLINRSISKERIIIENESINTKENILFCSKIIKNKSAIIVISTSGFHNFRALSIAKDCGFTKVSLCSENNFTVVTILNYTREFFALLNYYREKLLHRK